MPASAEQATGAFADRLQVVDSKREALEVAYQAYLDTGASDTCGAALHAAAEALDAMEGLSAWVKLVRDETAGQVWTGDLVKLYPELVEAYRILRQDAVRLGMEFSPPSSRWLRETQQLLCELEPAMAIDLAPATRAAGLPDGGFTVDALAYAALLQERVVAFRGASTPSAGAAGIRSAFGLLRSSAARSALSDHVTTLQGAVDGLTQLAAAGQAGWDKPIRFTDREVSEADRSYAALMACRDGLLDQARQVVEYARRARGSSKTQPIDEHLRGHYAKLLRLPGIADFLDSDAFHAFCLERSAEDAWDAAVAGRARGVRSLHGEDRLRTQALRDFLEGVGRDALPGFVMELVTSYESWRKQREPVSVAAAAAPTPPPAVLTEEEKKRMVAKASVSAFVTYSWADAGNEERVQGLAASLRGDGIACDIDKWDPVKAEGLPRWMTAKIRGADYVLCVCTESYCRRFEGREEEGKGLGANFEGKIITQAIHDAGGKNERFIPVLFTREDAKHIPEALKGAHYYVLDGQAGYDELYGRITEQPAHVAPPIGPVRTLPSREAKRSFAPAGSATAAAAEAAPAAPLVRQFKPIGVESDFSPDASGAFVAKWRLTTNELTPDEWLGVRVRLEVMTGDGTLVAVGEWVESRGYAGRWEMQRVPTPPVPGPGEHLMLARVESNDARHPRTFEPRQFVNRRQAFVAVR